MKLKLAIAFTIFGLSVLCPAPIRRAPEPGVPQTPMSMSQEQLERQQAEQQRMSEVGQVPQSTENKITPDSQATASASDTLRTATVDAAKDVLKTASKDMKTEENGKRSVWVFAAVMLAIGAGVVFAFRQWADKNVPMPQAKRKKQVW